VSDTKTSNSAWVYKCATVGAVLAIFEITSSGHRYLSLWIGTLVAALAQHFIPPRGQTWHLLILLAMALVLSSIVTVFHL